MIIKSIAIGNEEESFVEDRFDSGVNIIFSDDNNRGKTIVLQGIMFALGNTPIFPDSFDYLDYHYILEFAIDSKDFFICRKKNSFIIKSEKGLDLCDSVTEFKYFFNKNIYKLPEIIKDNKLKTVDLELFLQLFFLGQDRKDPSNIFNSGYYKKEDYLSMILSYMGLTSIQGEDVSENDLKQKILLLEKERKNILDKYKILKKATKELAIINYTNDKKFIEDKFNKINKVKDIITELSKDRYRSINRKIKNEQTLKEILSLNKTLNTGKISCMDCGSENIKYVSADKDYVFDISSIDIRHQIQNTISKRIEMYDEEIEKITNQINEQQDVLKELLKDDDIKLENILLLKDKIVDSSSGDSEIKKIDSQLVVLKDKLQSVKQQAETNEVKSKELFESIIRDLNLTYKQLDSTGNLVFNSLFSKKTTTYSGSEETEFYLSKLISLLKNLRHPFPLVIDSFREGELSTSKENTFLEIIKVFDNQIILSATLKEQELGKYEELDWINSIDYCVFQSSKLLQPSYNSEFKKLFASLQIV